MRTKPTITLVAVVLSSLSLPITLTGASVALPVITSELHGSLASVQWVVNGYLATFASFMLASGSLADMVGRRKIFAAGVAVFAVGGVLSALAWNVVLLDVVRVIAGVGGAAASSSAAALLASSFEGRARVRAFGLFGTALGVGLALGPTVAGLLMHAFGWRAVFGVPALAGLGALSLVPLLPESLVPGSRRVDWPGTASFTGALLLLIFGLVQGPSWGWSAPAVLGAFLGSIILLAAFFGVEQRQAQPMFDLRLLTNLRFIAILLAAATILSVPIPLVIYLPSYFTGVLGLGSEVAGLTLVLLTGPTLVLPLLGSMISKWVSPMAVVVFAVALIGAGAAWLIVIAPGIGVGGLLGPLLTMGCGLGLATGTVDGVAISSVSPSRAGTAAGMLNTFRLAIETIVLAVVGAVLATTTNGQLAGPGYTAGLHIVLGWMTGAVVLVIAAIMVLLRLGRTGTAGELAVEAVATG
ncbi:MAG: MFS transporter [Kutzneria sp.]|nr:MFS transporter [Kutzneria sp.]MBV9845205.1 MFS transporter [Kutzneria sp.]